MDTDPKRKPPLDASDEQFARFKEAARAAECDEDKARWEARLRQIAKPKPKPE